MIISSLCSKNDHDHCNEAQARSRAHDRERSADHPGSAVHAVHSGVVTQIGYIAGLENYVVVRSDEYTFVYQEAFSNKGNISVKVGQQINTGDVIGYRDTSHLHLGITRETNVMKAIANSFNNNGTWLDPRALIKNGIANQ